MAITGLDWLAKKKTDTSSTSGGGIVISVTKGDGRGNDAHLPAGTEGGHGGEFASKDEVATMGGEGSDKSEVSPSEEAPSITPRKNTPELDEKVKFVFNKAITNEMKLRENPTRKHLIAHRKNLVNKIISRRELTQTEIDDYSRKIGPLLKEMVNNSIITCNATPEGALGILSSGFYMNQFGSRRSRGHYSFADRFMASRNMFGHDLSTYEDGQGKLLEKYGCLRSKNLKLNIKNMTLSAAGEQYNDYTGIGFVLKRKHLPLVTMTSGDSLCGGYNSNIAPQLLNMPFDIFSTYKSGTNGLDNYVQTIRENIREPEVIGDYSAGYFECQIHMAELPISEFSCLLIPNFSQEKYGEIVKLAHDKKIKVIGGKYSERNDIDRKFYEFNVDSAGNIYDTIYDKEDIEDED